MNDPFTTCLTLLVVYVIFKLSVLLIPVMTFKNFAIALSFT